MKLSAKSDKKQLKSYINPLRCFDMWFHLQFLHNYKYIYLFIDVPTYVAYNRTFMLLNDSTYEIKITTDYIPDGTCSNLYKIRIFEPRLE